MASPSVRVQVVNEVATSDDQHSFVAQWRQVMGNLKLAVEGAGGRPDQIAVLTMYVTDLPAYLAAKKEIAVSYREVFGKYFPAITLVEVKGLYNPDCMIEISAVAVID